MTTIVTRRLLRGKTQHEGAERARRQPAVGSDKLVIGGAQPRCISRLTEHRLGIVAEPDDRRTRTDVRDDPGEPVVEAEPVHHDERGVVVSLPESLYFRPGSANLKPESLEALAKVATALASQPGQILMVDRIPVRSNIRPADAAGDLVKYLNKMLTNILGGN